MMKGTNSRNDQSPVALHVAIFEEDTEKAKYLINIGAALHAQDRNGCTPLHHAALKGNIAITKLLIEIAFG